MGLHSLSTLVTIVLVCLLCCWSMPAPTAATLGARDIPGASSSLIRSWYAKATHLLHEAKTEEFENKKKEEINRIISEIKVLGASLYKEEEKLDDLRRQQYALKNKWTWFLDPETRHKVDEAKLKVNDQRRVVESIFEDISVHWRQLKPHYGVFSQMFLAELFVFLLSPILSVLDFFFSTLSLGFLLFFIILGPVAFFFSAFAFSLGVALLPFIGSILVIIWTLEFPWLVIQYNPSPLEFALVYIPFLVASGALVWPFIKRVKGEGSIRIPITQRGPQVPPTRETRAKRD